MTRFLLLAAAFFTVAPAAAAVPCTALMDTPLPDVRMTSAVLVEPAEGQPVSVSHCRVEGVIGREIRFEVLLPVEWNGRFAMGGGGGFVGSVQNAAQWTVNHGYATAGTDTGHEGAGTSASWALNQPERQVNFGHLAVHRTAEVAKAIIRAYYGSGPDYAYFLGCSRGGGQALMEAQRYPSDFDGIVAGAPAFNWTGIGAEMVQNVQKLFPDSKNLDQPMLSPGQLRYLEDAVVRRCDAIDGVEDGLMEDPRDCTFDLGTLPRCSHTTDGGLCFTETQIDAVREVYAAPSNDGGDLFAGQPFGGEGDPSGWIGWITGMFEGWGDGAAPEFPSLHYAFGVDMYRYLVFNDPDWDYTEYDFSTWEKDTRYAAALLNATDPDLSTFAAEGGKLILWHGWSDAALSALASIDYYEDVVALDADAHDYFRMFLMPGVLHCGGGPGPDQVDWMSAITAWVERGDGPERIVASKMNAEGETLRTRPLCPYPQRAVYTGEGSTDDESAFVCRRP